MRATLIRCCPTSTRTLCRSCHSRLPQRIKDTLTGSRDELLAHAFAVDAALRWLEHNPVIHR